MINTGLPGDLTRDRVRMVRIPLFLQFECHPKDSLTWDSVMCFTVVLFQSFLLPLYFSLLLNFIMGTIVQYSLIS